MTSSFICFSKTNRRLLRWLIVSHLLWSCAILGLWSLGRLIAAPNWLASEFIAVQLFAAAQLLLPAQLLEPETRSRGFYLSWGLTLAVGIWWLNQLVAVGFWLPLLDAIKSGLLLLVATLLGAVLARYVQRLWEILPICIMMTLADFSSWAFGPTAAFTQQIQQYYTTPAAPQPLIDMVLIKLVFPGSTGFMPVFGISDWIMVVFFALVARRHGINDNLLAMTAKSPRRQAQLGRYLPISVVALFLATQLAQLSGLFIPALPLLALIMLLWFGAHALLQRSA